MHKLFNNLRITHSIAIIVVLAILSTAWIGYSGLQGMNAINQNVERINEEAVLRTQVAMELTNQLMVTRLEIGRLTAYGYFPSVADEVVKLNESTAALFTAYGEGICEDSNQQVLFDSAKRSHGEFLSTWETFLKDLEAHTRLSREVRVAQGAQERAAAAAAGEPVDEAATEAVEGELTEEEPLDASAEAAITVEEPPADEPPASAEEAPAAEPTGASTADQELQLYQLQSSVAQLSGSLETMGRSMINNLSIIMNQDREMAGMLYENSLAIHHANVRQMITTTLIAAIVLFFISLLVMLIIRSSTKEINGVFEIVATGDFTPELDENQRNEFGSIKRALSVTLSRVSETIQQTKQNMAYTDESAHALAKICDDMSVASQEVATSIQEVASGSNSQAEELAAISQILGDFGQELEGTVHVIETIQKDTEKTGDLVSAGSSQLNELMSSTAIIGQAFNDIGQQVQKLDKRLREIGDITNSINQISAQTNLLALNAAIEAARAGDAGRGFAVVADEVRKLAEQSSQSSAHINQLLEGIVRESHDIVSTTEDNILQLKKQEEVVHLSIDSFKAILNDITQLPPKISQANASINAVNQSKDTILTKIDHISSVAMDQSAIAQQIAAASQESSASVEEIASTAQVLNQMTRETTDLLDQFVTREQLAESGRPSMPYNAGGATGDSFDENEANQSDDQKSAPHEAFNDYQSDAPAFKDYDPAADALHEEVDDEEAPYVSGDSHELPETKDDAEEEKLH